MTTPHESAMNERTGPVFRSHQEAMIKGDMAVIDELYGEDFVNHSPGLPDDMRNGPGAIKGSYGFLRSAFSDMVIEHHDVIVDGDLVGLRWTWHATHVGPFLGIPPTGARVSIEGYDLILVSDGKIRGAWVYQDNLDLMAQLGAASASQAAAEG